MMTLQELYTEFNEKYTDANVHDLVSLVDAVKANKEVESKYKNVVRGGEFFKINLETRAITVPASYKSNGLGVVGDDAADVAYFKLDRYYGQTDLKDCQIVIVWQVGKEDPQFSAAYAKEVTNDAITFGWVIDRRIVAEAGKVKFSVRIFQLHEDAPAPDLLYSLNTTEVTCDVKNSTKYNVATMAALDMEALEKANEEALGLSHVHANDGEKEPEPVVEEPKAEEPVVNPEGEGTEGEGGEAAPDDEN